jgi:hypothetical protein
MKVVTGTCPDFIYCSTVSLELRIAQEGLVHTE